MSALKSESLSFNNQIHRASASWKGELVDDNLVLDVPLGMFKPAWGFWTSSRQADGTSEWTRYAKQFDGRGRHRNFEFEVIGAPRVLILESDDDVDAVLAHYGGERFGVEDMMIAHGFTPEDMDRYHRSMQSFTEAWSRITREFDAAHVPSNFLKGNALRSWDVESTVWFKPATFLRSIS